MSIPPKSLPIRVLAMSPGNPEPPKALPLRLAFATGALQYTGNLSQLQQNTRFQSLRSIYYNAEGCANNVAIAFPLVGQTMTLLAGKQGYRQVLVDEIGEFSVTGTAGDTVIIHLLNVDIPSFDWPNSDTSILPADIVISNAPSVIGGNVNGPAVEIHAGTNDRLLAQTGGALSFTQLTDGMVPANTIALSKLGNAAAQFDLVGRKTAGAGAWEDSTRAQLNIPGLELANVFTVGQEIDAPSGTVLKLVAAAFTGFQPTNSALVLQNNDAGASGPSFSMYHNSATPAANDFIRLAWFFNNTLGTAVRAAQLISSLLDPTAGAESGSYGIATLQAGVVAARFTIAAGMFSNGSADPGAGSIAITGFYKGGVFTVGTLPAAATAGANARAAVTDALAPAYLVALAAGGAAFSGALSTGAAWLSG